MICLILVSIITQCQTEMLPSESLYLKALKIAEQVLEADHPNRFIFRENYKLCLKAKKSKPRSAKNKGFGRSPTMK